MTTGASQKPRDDRRNLGQVGSGAARATVSRILMAAVEPGREELRPPLTRSR
jgi:hypothetical protein